MGGIGLVIGAAGVGDLAKRRMTAHEAHWRIWKVWRVLDVWALDEAQAYAAIMATGTDCLAAAAFIRDLVQAGDLAVTWNRDFGFYTPIKDPWGDPARKASGV